MSVGEAWHGGNDDGIGDRKRCHLQMTARTATWSLQDAGRKQVAHSAS